MNQTDLKLRQALASKQKAHEEKTRTGLALSLEEFFTGNEDYGSIGCNLSDHPGPQRFYDVLRELRDRKGVQDVVIQLHEYEGDSSWPFSELVHVVTKFDPDTIRDWVAELQPDEVAYGPFDSSCGNPVGLPEPQSGYRIVTLWWD
jgi:hypothetical protein